jgi:hypothetical protein
MKKNVLVLGVLLALLLGSCQGIFSPTASTGPTADSAATSDALFKTAVAQTLTARPTLPLSLHERHANRPGNVAIASRTRHRYTNDDANARRLHNSC